MNGVAVDAAGDRVHPPPHLSDLGRKVILDRHFVELEWCGGWRLSGSLLGLGRIENSFTTKSWSNVPGPKGRQCAIFYQLGNQRQHHQIYVLCTCHDLARMGFRAGVASCRRIAIHVFE